jgi:hypothetical protein
MHGQGMRSWIRQALVPSKKRRRKPLGAAPKGATKPVYVTLTWKSASGSHTIKRVHFDMVEAELLNLLRRGLDATVWTEGENPREVGWVWINGNKGVQCIEKWD